MIPSRTPEGPSTVQLEYMKGAVQLGTVNDGQMTVHVRVNYARDASEHASGEEDQEHAIFGPRFGQLPEHPQGKKTEGGIGGEIDCRSQIETNP